MRAKLAVVIGVLGLLLGPAVAPVFAHHGFMAEFDANKPVHFRGTVTRIEWTNPHTRISVDVEKSGGTVETWTIEAGTPYVLVRRGITKKSLMPGTEIAIAGYLAKDGSRRVTVNHPYAAITREEIVPVTR